MLEEVVLVEVVLAEVVAIDEVVGWTKEVDWRVEVEVVPSPDTITRVLWLVDSMVETKVSTFGVAKVVEVA